MVSDPSWIQVVIAALGVVQVVALAYIASRSKQRRSEDKAAATGSPEASNVRLVGRTMNLSLDEPRGPL